MRKAIAKALAAQGLTAYSFVKQHPEIVSQVAFTEFMKGEKFLSLKNCEAVLAALDLVISDKKEIAETTFHAAIKKAFERAGVSQYEFCNKNGISKPAFSLFLSKEKGVGTDTAAKICKALGLIFLPKKEFKLQGGLFSTPIRAAMKGMRRTAEQVATACDTTASKINGYLQGKAHVLSVDSLERILQHLGLQVGGCDTIRAAIKAELARRELLPCVFAGKNGIHAGAFAGFLKGKPLLSLEKVENVCNLLNISVEDKA